MTHYKRSAADSARSLSATTTTLDVDAASNMSATHSAAIVWSRVAHRHRAADVAADAALIVVDFDVARRRRTVVEAVLVRLRQRWRRRRRRRSCRRRRRQHRFRRRRRCAGGVWCRRRRRRRNRAALLRRRNRMRTKSNEKRKAIDTKRTLGESAAVVARAMRSTNVGDGALPVRAQQQIRHLSQSE